MPTLSTTQTNTFDYTGAIETATVGAAGYYDITADGAQGGDGAATTVAGGPGAMARGEVFLQAGATLEIVVGGEGHNSTSGGGGGGGSFVIETDNGSGAV